MEAETTLIYSATDSSEYFNSSGITMNPTVSAETLKWTSAEIARWIQIVIRPILVVFGTVGNCLTVYIMRTTSMKKISSCFYMFLLALIDTLVLWSGCFVSWIQKLTREKVSPYTWTDCKLGFFLYYFGREYSSMLLVLMSVEKCFAVYFPLKSKTVCTLRTAKLATGSIGFILASYNVHWFLVVESKISKWSGFPGCVPTKHYHNSFLSVDSVLYSFGAFVFMFVINFAIALKFIRAKCNGSSTESTNQALVKAATRGTAMVVTVSVMFLILTAPTSVNYALHKWYPLAGRFPQYKLFMNITQYLNHSINGVLYCIVGTRFRMELFKIFSRKKKLKNVASTHSVNNTSLTYISGNDG